MQAPLPPNHFYFLGEGLDPSIELWSDDAAQRSIPLAWVGSGRNSEECLWLADLAGLPLNNGEPGQPEWQFRINLGDGRLLHPEFAPAYTTTLLSLWLQDGQIFDYQPAPAVSPPSVVKIEQFHGSLGPRPLYVYLPRGYAEHTERRYPVLYMHDGQNCFDAFVDDSYAGAWQADLAASLLIRQGLMQECLIVGVSNGQEQRILEYLPPYARHLPPPRSPRVAVDHGDQPPAPQRPLLPVPGTKHPGLVPRRGCAFRGISLPCAAGAGTHCHLRIIAGWDLLHLYRLGTQRFCAPPCGALHLVLDHAQPRRQAGGHRAHARPAAA